MPLTYGCCSLPTLSTLARGGRTFACGPPATFCVHMASSAVTPAGPVHKSSGDNVVRAVEEMMCVVYVRVTKGE